MNSYRLLDVGEQANETDEFWDRDGEWKPLFLPVVVADFYTPIRRPDDGKGQYLLCGEVDGEQFWRWGAGWLSGVNTAHVVQPTTWRKARRRVVQMFALVRMENILCSGSEAHCRSEAEKCANAFPENAYSVCELVAVAIYRTKTVTENKVVIEEVGK